MRQSMTGFASVQGTGFGLNWTWELRGVNGKGLDLRFRVPDWIDGLEAQARVLATKTLTRGNVQIGLRIVSEGGEGTLRLDAVQMAAVLDAMTEIEADAMARGLSLAPSTAAEIVTVRGMLTNQSAVVDQKALCAQLLEDFKTALEEFSQMRAAEGDALAQVLARQIAEIETLTTRAAEAAQARGLAQKDRLAAQLARVMENVDGIEEGRIAQELALIAVKSDITEELDRLQAHVVAARALLQTQGAIGRKLDFLMQEFNREANTLCSKAGDADLTRIGLDLKTVIDQMREQVQNVE